MQFRYPVGERRFESKSTAFVAKKHQNRLCTLNSPTRTKLLRSDGPSSGFILEKGSSMELFLDVPRRALIARIAERR